MDVEEFMNQVFDRIETHLKDHPMQHFLKTHFGGKMAQQIISKVLKFSSSILFSFAYVFIEFLGMHY